MTIKLTLVPRIDLGLADANRDAKVHDDFIWTKLGASYLFNPAAQFRTIVIGADSVSSVAVLTRKCCPSGETT